MAGRGSGSRGIRRDLARGREVPAAHLAAHVLRQAARGQQRLRIEGARFTGIVDLRQARLGLDLEFVNCVFDSEIWLTGAEVQSLDLTGSTLTALRADRIRVHGDLLLRATRIGDGTRPPSSLTDPGFSGDQALEPRRVPDGAAAALVHLTAATIDGALILERAALAGPGPWALFTPRASVGDSFLASGLKAQGALYLRDVRVAQNLLLDHAEVAGVDATGLSCAGGFYADWGFTATGPVRLRGAEVGRVVTFHDASLASPAASLTLARLATPRLRLDFRSVPAGDVVLRDARIGSLVDAPAVWPEPGRLDVEGLTYRRLSAVTPVTVGERLDWLSRDPAAGASSFEQLALSYLQAGNERSARLVRHARERRLRRQDGPAGRLWGALQDILFGYGYAPGRALLWLLLLVGCGSAWFATHVPNATDGGSRLTWDPVMYTLDLIVPFANLGQRNAWDPTGADRVIATGLVLAGWLLGTAVIAGARRALGRN